MHQTTGFFNNNKPAHNAKPVRQFLAKENHGSSRPLIFARLGPRDYFVFQKFNSKGRRFDDIPTI